MRELIRAISVDMTMSVSNLDWDSLISKAMTSVGLFFLKYLKLSSLILALFTKEIVISPLFFIFSKEMVLRIIFLMLLGLTGILLCKFFMAIFTTYLEITQKLSFLTRIFADYN